MAFTKAHAAQFIVFQHTSVFWSYREKSVDDKRGKCSSVCFSALQRSRKIIAFWQNGGKKAKIIIQQYQLSRKFKADYSVEEFITFLLRWVYQCTFRATRTSDPNSS